ncbi:hypothetical protein [Gemmatimonas sp.]|uniref:hypothetical protein n=1 Tax=Gemmatimonas sp. TaxID=1962908 RepID=UPI003F6F777F
MAEINIQQKENDVWPWLLAGILLHGLVWFLVAWNNTDTMTASGVGSTAVRDSSAGAGTLAPPDSGTRQDTRRDAASVPR